MHRPKIDNAAVTERFKHNLSCHWTGSADFGRLIPIHWEELVQGDHIVKFKPKIEMQMLAFASPTFTKIDVYCHTFVVPIRQLQAHFYDIWSRTGDFKDSNLQYFLPKEFARIYNSDFTQQLEHLRSAAFKHWTSMGLNPFFTLSGANLNNDASVPVWLAPFFAYNKIWWDFYRDPELIRDESKSDYLYDGDVNGQIPSGFVQAEFPMKFLMPHIRTIKNCWLSDLFSSSGQGLDSSGEFNVQQVFGVHSLPYPNYIGQGDSSFESDTPLFTDLRDNALSAQIEDFQFAQGATPNSSQVLRLLEAINRLSERLSLSGKRQIEALYARYGVKPDYAKMTLARYTGGAKNYVLVDDIISTADTDNMPLGGKAGAGYANLENLEIEVSVDEPSIFMAIVSVMPHIHFVQGLSKKWQRKSLVDMFQSSLQYVGNVGVARREVGYKYSTATPYDKTKDGQVFAYSDPYYEYKMGLDILAGDFMKYHNINLPQDPTEQKQVAYMQSMENFIDFPVDRDFDYNNFMVDGDQFNKIFTYLGGSAWEAGDDHFHIDIDKEFIIERPMEGFAIPTLETTQDPHVKKAKLSEDKML